ncbi:MAG: helix-turn-helix transcriptional regulator [Clostridia bacterium]|nr:helix-turn-helix transcriptional regulator [Clostridia bacterium]
MVNFGKRLRTLRYNNGWTQETVAIRLGVTKSVVSAYETSLRYPSYDILIRIARLFHVSTDYLLGVDTSPETSSLRALDISGLSPENEQLIRQLVDALRNSSES